MLTGVKPNNDVCFVFYVASILVSVFCVVCLVLALVSGWAWLS